MDWARRIELFTVVVASVVAVVGLWYSNVQTRQANEQARQANEQARDDRALAKEGQITDRYTAAVGNLGEDKMDVRLGGIYALERIMQDSRRDQPTIANVLATYIRTHAAKPPAKGQDIPADVHAALTVLAARDTTRDGRFLLNLHGAKLPNSTFVFPAKAAVALHRAKLDGSRLTTEYLLGADLSDAYLRDIFVRSTSLHRTNLVGVNLSDTDLRGANLSSADLLSADLSGADLRGANLRGAGMVGADLHGTDLRGANLRGTDLRGTDLTKQQVDSAVTDRETRLR
ncbi:pentapeptide repeat-containing protein [Streptomyces microflavus]|uniref:pentapeptide repeat-containing protein n=1 Tax=Streptomyces microflavus TaxID=1919 RepID=UPI00341BB19E